MSEASASFECFGSSCGVWVSGRGPLGSAAQALASCQRALLAWHERFTRFSPTSELSRLNADPAGEVEVSPIMARFVGAALQAARATGGLVDPTQLGTLEAAGYDGQLGAPLPLRLALRLAPPRRPARAPARPAWRQVEVDVAAGRVRRPPGVRLDSGGIVKGLLADVLAEALSEYESFAVDCAGDVRVGGLPREVRIVSPFDDQTLHRLELADAGIATSGIGRRSWMRDGRPMHHLLDAATGTPAFTGIVQATALAPTALEAEWRAKAAVLRGPDEAERGLPHGGLLVLDDGSTRLLAPALHAA